MSANFALVMDEAPDAVAKGLRTALTREKALQSYLEQQHFEVEDEISKAQHTAASLVRCRAASERVHRSLDALRAAVTESKDSISNAIDVHDSEAEATDEMTTISKAKDAWRNLEQLLEALTPQISSTTTSTRSHILHTSDRVSTFNFLVECTQQSIASLDLSLDAIATCLEFKRKGLSSLFRIPDEVFGMIFQFAVEEERKKLHAEFSSPSHSFDTLHDMKRTIPASSFTLAAVCRRWRNIALHTPKLWSHIRLYTSFCTAQSTRKKRATYCWVGKAAFEWSLRRAKGTLVELTIYQDFYQQLCTSPAIPSSARISVIHLVRLGLIPRWLPSCLHLSLYARAMPVYSWGDNVLNRVEFPGFPTAPKEISCTNILPTFLAPLDLTTSFNFCSDHRSQIPNVNQLREKLPKLEVLQLLPPDVQVQSLPSAVPGLLDPVPRTWKSLTALRVTSSALPCLATGAQERLSLPSLITLILTNVFASFKPSIYKDIKHIVQKLTSLEIHNISPHADPAELRVFIDWMECLQTIILQRPPVQKIVKALSITPAKSIKKLIIEGKVLEGVELRDYTALLEGVDDNTAFLEGVDDLAEDSEALGFAFLPKVDMTCTPSSFQD